MKIEIIDGYKIAMPISGKVTTASDLKALYEFAVNPINSCDGFYAEGRAGTVYNYVNNKAVAIGQAKNPKYVLFKERERILRGDEERIEDIENLKTDKETIKRILQDSIDNLNKVLQKLGKQ